MNNDIISRDYVANKICNLYFDRENANKKDRVINKVMDIIDNAPTVSDRYEEGYAQGYIDGSTGADMKGGAE